MTDPNHLADFLETRAIVLAALDEISYNYRSVIPPVWKWGTEKKECTDD